MISVGRVIQHVQKSKEVQSHPEAYFHRSESLLFRQVELKEKNKNKRSHLVGRALGTETGRVSRTASWDMQSSMMKLMMMVSGEQND